MNLGNVMDDLGMGLGLIDGLRVHPYWATQISPPAAIIGWPDPLSFDSTMGRGGDRIDLPIYVLVGKIDARSSRDQLSRYLAGSGGDSIKAALERESGWSHHSFHSCRVKSAQVEVMTVAAVDYLAATFRVDIIGGGQ